MRQKAVEPEQKGKVVQSKFLKARVGEWPPQKNQFGTTKQKMSLLKQMQDRCGQGTCEGRRDPQSYKPSTGSAAMLHGVRHSLQRLVVKL